MEDALFAPRFERLVTEGRTQMQRIQEAECSVGDLIDEVVRLSSDIRRYVEKCRESWMPVHPADQALADQFSRESKVVCYYAKQIGVSHDHARRFLTVARRFPEGTYVRSLVREGQLRFGHLRYLLSVPDDDTAAQIARRVIREGLSTQSTRRLVYHGHPDQEAARVCSVCGSPIASTELVTVHFPDGPCDFVHRIGLNCLLRYAEGGHRPTPLNLAGTRTLHGACRPREALAV